MYSSTHSLTSALGGVGGQSDAPTALPTVQETGWPVWEGAENLTPTWIRSPVRSAGSESLYRLRFPGHCMYVCVCIYIYIPGVPSDSGNTGDSGNSDFRVTQGTRGDSENPEFRVTWEPGFPGIRFSGLLRDPWVPGGPGNPYFRMATEIRSSGDSENPDFVVNAKIGVPVDSKNPIASGNPEFWITPVSTWLREPTFSSDSANPEFRVTPGTLSSGWLRVPRFPVSPEFRMNPWSRSSGNPDLSFLLGVPCDSRFPEFRLIPGNRVTLGIRSSGWPRKSGFAGDSGQEPGVPCDPGNPKSRVTPWTRRCGWLHPGTGTPGWLREYNGFPYSPRVPGVTRNKPEQRVPVVTPGSMRHPDLRFSGVTRIYIIYIYLCMHMYK